MKAKFFTIGSFLVRSRNLFVAVGDVTEGEVQPGMNVEVDLGHLRVGANVASVEVIEVAFRNQAYLGLAFAFEGPEDLEFWQELQLSDETLELSVG
jgi:hypothetical protein